MKNTRFDHKECENSIGEVQGHEKEQKAAENNRIRK
jgi:hypothetical protein